MFLWLVQQFFGGKRQPIRANPAPRVPRRRTGFCPRLESLEDRTVPSAVATHFQVVAPSSAEVNHAAEIEVVALDASNHTVANYSGTVKLTDTAGKPLLYHFSARDHGTHLFQVTPHHAQAVTVTASDAAHHLSGQNSFDVTPAAPTHFLVIVDRSHDGSGSESGDNAGSSASPSDAGSGQAYVGVATTVEVIALDANNNVVPNYVGTVTLASTDGLTTLADGTSPSTYTYTFTTADQGAHSFSILPGQAGSETLTVSDSANNLSGTATLNVSAAPVASQLQVDLCGNVQAGQPTAVEVKVLDASGQVVPNYTGTIQLTTSDAGATVSGGNTYTFTPADEGEHVFWVTFSANGSPTLTLTDTANNLTATVTVNVPSTGSGSSDGGGNSGDTGGNSGDRGGKSSSGGGSSDSGNSNSVQDNAAHLHHARHRMKSVHH